MIAISEFHLTELSDSCDLKDKCLKNFHVARVYSSMVSLSHTPSPRGNISPSPLQPHTTSSAFLNQYSHSAGHVYLVGPVTLCHSNP